MLKKIALFALMFSFLMAWAQAQPARTKKDRRLKKPMMKKNFPSVPKNRGRQAKSKSFDSRKRHRMQQQNFNQKLQQKKRTRTRGMTQIYPPYVDAWAQKWRKGTGVVHNATAQRDGHVYQSAVSDAWGMAGSRGWVSVKYVPPSNGYYRITLWAYQQGGLWLHTQYPGDEVYAYRSLGLEVNGNLHNQCIDEYYFDQPGGQREFLFDNWASVSREYYMKAGQTYWIMGYSEIGGWSNGSGEAWQSTESSSCLAPFEIQYTRGG